jgi:hypothetical protein
MKIYQLTNLGDDLGKSPDMNPSDAKKILYYMRSHRGSVSDEQIRRFVVPDKWQMRKAIRELKSVDAIREITA